MSTNISAISNKNTFQTLSNRSHIKPLFSTSILRTIFDHFFLNEWATYRQACTQWYQLYPYKGRLDISHKKITTDRVISLLNEFQKRCQLISIYLNYCPLITGRIFPTLSSLPYLLKINFQGCKKITSEKGLNHFTSATVTKLDLADCGLNSKDVSLLTNLPNLKKLSLAFNKKRLPPGESPSLRQFTTLRSLNLNGNAICNDVLDKLSALPLEKLFLRFCTQLTLKGFSYLKKISHLTHLALDNTQFTDAGCAYLQNYQLVELSLYGCNITEKGLSSLNPSHLKRLNIGRTKVTDISFLRKFIHLNMLFLENCTIFNESFKKIKSLRLKYLNLSHTPVTDTVLKVISNFPLQILYINNCTLITNKGLDHFRNLTTLKTLSISDCPKITNDGLLYLNSLPLDKNSKKEIRALYVKQISFLEYQPPKEILSPAEAIIHTIAFTNMSLSAPKILILKYISDDEIV